MVVIHQHLLQNRHLPHDTLDIMLAERDLILRELRDNLNRAQSAMKMTADKKRRDFEFKEGEMVFLKLRPYRMRSLAIRRNEKLAPRYFGLYRISQRAGKVAYKLELPYSSTIHPVFHI